MKKLLLIALSTIFIAGCSTTTRPSVELPNETTGIITITEDQFYQLALDGKEFLFYVGSPMCSACVAFKPTVTEYTVTSGLPVYYIDIDEGFKSSSDMRVFFKKYFETSEPSTPTVGYVKSSKVVSHRVGLMTATELTEYIEASKLK